MNLNIVFCTLACGEKYREISLNLINSLRTHYPEYKTIVATDDPEYYPYYENTDVTKVNYDSEINFPFSLKFYPIKYITQRFPANLIIYLDADNIVSRREPLGPFLELEEGMYNVPCLVDGVNGISNGIIRDRVKQYIQENEKVFLFPEQTFIFKLSNRVRFLHFLQEWENLYNKMLEISEYQNYECVELCLACQRAGLPIKNIKEFLLKESRGLFLSKTIDGNFSDSLL